MRALVSPAGLTRDGNPYVSLLYDALRPRGVSTVALTRRRLLGEWDVVHVHWPESLVRWTDGPVRAWTDVGKVVVCLWVARRRGAALVWTGHNLRPHEVRRPRLFGLYLAVFTRMVDLVISLSDAASDSLREHHRALRGTPFVTVPHGHYRDSYARPRSAADARRDLGVPEDLPVLLLMGQIRRYKNVLGLIRAFETEFSARAHLVVAGSATGDEEYGALVEEAARRCRNVTLRLGRVPEGEVPLLHAASDVVVLPYASGSALHSGAAILALSLDRPVVVPASGTMGELRASVGSAWVHPFEGGPREALLEALEAVGTTPRPPADFERLEWESIGVATAEAFRLARGSRAVSCP